MEHLKVGTGMMIDDLALIECSGSFYRQEGQGAERRVTAANIE